MLGVVEIGERARNSKHPVIAARRQPHGVGGIAQQRHPGLVRFGGLFQHRARHLRIGERGGQTECRVTPRLNVACAGNAGSDLRRALGRRRQDQVGGGDRRYLDMQIDAVQQRAGKLGLIIGGATDIRAACS